MRSTISPLPQWALGKSPKFLWFSWFWSKSCFPVFGLICPASFSAFNSFLVFGRTILDLLLFDPTLFSWKPCFTVCALICPADFPVFGLTKSGFPLFGPTLFWFKSCFLVFGLIYPQNFPLFSDTRYIKFPCLCSQRKISMPCFKWVLSQGEGHSGHNIDCWLTVGCIMHNGLTFSPSSYPIEYLKPFLPK